MQYNNHLKNRGSKLQFLQGLLTGKHTIYEVLEYRVCFFGETDKPDLYYLWDGEQENFTLPKIVDGNPVLLTREQVEAMDKQPNCVSKIVCLTPYDNGVRYLALLKEAIGIYNKKQQQ